MDPAFRHDIFQMELVEDENLVDIWPVEVKLETEEDVPEFNKPILVTKKSKRSRNPKVSCCPHCDYSTTRRDHFKRHVLRHPEQELFTVGGSGREGKKPRTCCECGYTTMRKDHFQRHMMRHTGEKPYSCMTCGYATTHSIHLKRHILRHGHEPNPQIEIKEEPNYGINEEEESEWPLEVKLEEVEDESPGVQVKRRKEKGPHRCNECGYTTLRSDHFKRHMMRHTGEKPFVCTICSFATSRAVRLKNHMATHFDNNRPYSCEMCPYHTTQLGRLRTHIRQHI